VHQSLPLCRNRTKDLRASQSPRYSWSSCHRLHQSLISHHLCDRPKKDRKIESNKLKSIIQD